jgi:hypothetical protein|tara:strand:- start:1333 stop:1938 length:606 start_codon:yes stop_codon:yes gene_type:complete
MIVNELLKNKHKVQNFLNNLNCDDDKWFVYNCDTGDNPTLRKFSHRMSYRIMNNNTEMFKCRFLYLKVKKDMRVTCEHYDEIEVDDMDIEIDKYDDIGDGFIRKNLFGELTELFSDDRIYTVHYIEALGGVDPHRDPWIYDSNYRNIIFYDNLPEDAILTINENNIPIKSPQHTNFGIDTHSYQFKTRKFPLKILHIDYEN